MKYRKTYITNRNKVSILLKKGRMSATTPGKEDVVFHSKKDCSCQESRRKMSGRNKENEKDLKGREFPQHFSIKVKKKSKGRNEEMDEAEMTRIRRLKKT